MTSLGKFVLVLFSMEGFLTIVRLSVSSGQLHTKVMFIARFHAELHPNVT